MPTVNQSKMVFRLLLKGSLGTPTSLDRVGDQQDHLKPPANHLIRL